MGNYPDPYLYSDESTSSLPLFQVYPLTNRIVFKALICPYSKRDFLYVCRILKVKVFLLKEGEEK
ncbi:hypothetical protein SAMN05421687_10577 [Salimicrobium flavidum]|uniref:Uncharacterized protein n=1 Tax=Salimicrobium flavidum TaxID=570947 RepID=A0A1N7JDE2_9BACI|nr:hypothetical protein SAMN05421687_10577 [Salimicrobium flavidum]